MEIIRGISNFKPKHQGNVITIGNFDGVHLGHQAIINKLKSQAEKYQVPATVMTFHPNPQEFFAPQAAPAKLTGFHEKMSLLRNYGVDRVICIPFNARLANLDAQHFVENILINGLHAKHLVIGDDFRFGKNRHGDFQMLQAAGEAYGFDVENTPTVCVDNERVSSTRIRNALNSGDLNKAAQLLGRRFYVSGKVVHGDKRGRQIGFPTANIRLKQQIAPKNGVYAVRITDTGKTLSGVANLGVRPTFDGSQYLLEVHIFDFTQEIYHHRLSVEFEHFIRTEQKFDGLDALIAQINRDTEIAKQLLNNQAI